MNEQTNQPSNQSLCRSVSRKFGCLSSLVSRRLFPSAFPSSSAWPSRRRCTWQNRYDRRCSSKNALPSFWPSCTWRNRKEIKDDYFAEQIARKSGQTERERKIKRGRNWRMDGHGRTQTERPDEEGEER